jgi:deoxyribonuclease-4
MIRVRPILSLLNSVERTELKKLLPPKLKVPEEPAGVRYPNALLGVLPKEESYALLGWISEDLLHYPPEEITLDRLRSVAVARCPALTAEALGKVAKSKTTEPFLQHVRETSKKLRAVARGALRPEEEVGAPGPVRGHPDMRTESQLFEIKMTGQLKKNWVDFLFQVFAYGALAPEATDLYLVLPLQEIVWHFELKGWAHRAAYRTFLENAATKKGANNGDVSLLLAEYPVGAHIHKAKRLSDSFATVAAERPYQLFLGGPQSSKLLISDEELMASATVIQSRGLKVFVHSQYLINLSTPAGVSEDYHVKLLIKNLQYGVAIGAAGVVVHVGKSTTQTVEVAVANMRSNILTALEHASPSCPLLLETPAGQGTETLKGVAEFNDFVASIDDARFGICVDSCHVFACGHAPVDYIRATLDKHAPRLRLIHYNDSATACGSCLDRHAMVGQGHIGLATMTEIANLATSYGIPMVIE